MPHGLRTGLAHLVQAPFCETCIPVGQLGTLSCPYSELGPPQPRSPFRAATAQGLLPPPVGLQDGVYEALRYITWAKGVQLEASNYSTYLHPDPSTMPEIWSVSAWGWAQWGGPSNWKAHRLASWPHSSPHLGPRHRGS